jgi:ketosteroid isomerase-like protein
MYEASARRRFDLMPHYFDPDVELIVPDTRPDPGVYRGLEELFRWMGTWYTDLFESFQVEVLSIRQYGEAVVVEQRLRGKGRVSGAEVSEVSASVNIVRNGVIVRHHAEANLEDAIRIAREEAGGPA